MVKIYAKIGYRSLNMVHRSKCKIQSIYTIVKKCLKQKIDNFYFLRKRFIIDRKHFFVLSYIGT